MSAAENFAKLFFPDWAAQQAVKYNQGVAQPDINFLQNMKDQMTPNVFPSANPDQYNGLMTQNQQTQNSPLMGLINAAIASKSPQMIPAFQQAQTSELGLQGKELANRFALQKMNLFRDMSNKINGIGGDQSNPAANQRGIGYAGWMLGLPGSSGLVTNANTFDPRIQYDKTNAVNNATAGLDYNGNPTDSLDQMAYSVGNYLQAPPSGRQLTTPNGRALMNRVRQLYPNYDEKNYQLFQKTLDAYGSGNLGDITRRMSVAIHHSNLTSQLVDQLNNGDVPALNKIENYYLQQKGSPAPNNMEAAKLFLTDEITRGLIGANAGEGDRERLLATISNSHSMSQLKGVINTYKAFMAGQLKGLRKQYMANTHRSEGDFNRLLLPGTEKELDAAEKELMAGNKSQAGWPKAGTVVNGWTYKGGDPHDQSNWTR